jgi:hypothetical protein
MRILVGYTDLRPEVSEALDRYAVPYGHTIAYEDCRPSTDRYHEALAQEWRAGADFAVVEHDIVIDQRVFPAFEACEEPWCGFGYDAAVGYKVMLGCTRFRSELVQAVPDLLELCASETQSGVPARAWYRLDVRVDEVLRRRGYTAHLHMPPIRHLNETNRLAEPLPVWQPEAAGRTYQPRA